MTQKAKEVVYISGLGAAGELLRFLVLGVAGMGAGEFPDRVASERLLRDAVECLELELFLVPV